MMLALLSPVENHFAACATGLPVRTKLQTLVTHSRSNKLTLDSKQPECDGMEYQLFE